MKFIVGQGCRLRVRSTLKYHEKEAFVEAFRKTGGRFSAGRNKAYDLPKRGLQDRNSTSQ
jgi:hypothetical protein